MIHRGLVRPTLSDPDLDPHTGNQRRRPETVAFFPPEDPNLDCVLFRDPVSRLDPRMESTAIECVLLVH